MNIGYIKWWKDHRLMEWNENLERVAGGYDAGTDGHAQHLSMTGMSSFLAMVSTAWFEYKIDGKVPPFAKPYFVFNMFII